MYKVLYLRLFSSGNTEHREIACSDVNDANRVRIMLRDDPCARDISIWRGAVRLN
jgi:hypothetical protein